jgi:hypothetical protein
MFKSLLMEKIGSSNQQQKIKSRSFEGKKLSSVHPRSEELVLEGQEAPRWLVVWGRTVFRQIWKRDPPLLTI